MTNDKEFNAKAQSPPFGRAQGRQKGAKEIRGEKLRVAFRLPSRLCVKIFSSNSRAPCTVPHRLWRGVYSRKSRGNPLKHCVGFTKPQEKSS